MTEPLLESDITKDIIGAFYEVYNTLGFGFLEHVYALALERELLARGRKVRREAIIPIFYKGEILTNQRVDLVVEERVVVELKSSAVLPALAKRQTLNYVRASNLKVALLLHFGPERVFYRFVHSQRPGSIPTEVITNPFEPLEGS